VIRPAAGTLFLLPDTRAEGRTGAGFAESPEGLSFALARIAMNVHGTADSRIDALGHVTYGGQCRWA
jgi:hypothetical protein